MIKPSAEEARQQLIELGGEITSTQLKIGDHYASVRSENHTDGTSFKVCVTDYLIPREYRDAMEAREFYTAEEAKTFLEKALDQYDNATSVLIEGLGKI